MSERAIRVLIVEDSPTIRYYLARLINAAPGLQVVGEARDGAEAVKMAESLRPDVISMDIRMPNIDGLEAARRIMARHPTPIVMVSAVLDDEIDLSFQAMQAGALAVIPKPAVRGTGILTDQARQLTTTLTAMADVRVIRRWEQDNNPEPSAAHTAETLEFKPVKTSSFARNLPLDVVAIGASAGGPSALSLLLGNLPSDFPVPVLIVQHLPDEFMIGLARWLGDTTPLNVEVAESGMALLPGGVYLSPGGAHLTVTHGTYGLVAQLLPNDNNRRYCPSVDVMLESIAQVCGARAAGIILTGMGDDGAVGLKRLRAAGGHTFAQDQRGCAVYGMPAAAIAQGGVEEVVVLDDFPRLLVKLCGGN